MVILITFILPHPTDFQLFVLRVVASLSAAAIASVVPGVIEVKLEGWASKMLRVGAAVAVFIATYLFFSLKLLNLRRIRVIMLANIKNSLLATHRVVGAKHLPRYLGAFAWRFNRRFVLKSIHERLAIAATTTPPMPYRLLKLAEARW
jgi:hypothetical protein